MISFINSDGDNLGLTDKITDAGELPILVEYIQPILNQLYKNDNEIPVFCFKVRYSDIDKIKMFIPYLERDFHANFYETDGRKIFEVRSNGGGITMYSVIYLMGKKS